MKNCIATLPMIIVFNSINKQFGTQLYNYCEVARIHYFSVIDITPVIYLHGNSLLFQQDELTTWLADSNSVYLDTSSVVSILCPNSETMNHTPLLQVEYR